jgi:hypothetical protein
VRQGTGREARNPSDRRLALTHPAGAQPFQEGSIRQPARTAPEQPTLSGPGYALPRRSRSVQPGISCNRNTGDPRRHVPVPGPGPTTARRHPCCPTIRFDFGTRMTGDVRDATKSLPEPDAARRDDFLRALC